MTQSSPNIVREMARDDDAPLPPKVSKAIRDDESAAPDDIMGSPRKSPRKPLKSRMGPASASVVAPEEERYVRTSPKILFKLTRLQVAIRF